MDAIRKKKPGITFNAQKHLCIKQELASMITMTRTENKIFLSI